MVLQIPADSGQITDYGNMKLTQMLRRTDAGQHEQLRRADGPSAENDLALRALLAAAVCVGKADDRGVAAFKVNSKNVSLGADSQIGPRHCRAQKCRCSAVTLALGLCDLIQSKAFLPCPVEIVVTFKAGLFSGLNKCLRERIGCAEITHAQRAI